MKKFFFLLFFIPVLAWSQAGMQFEHNTTWQAIKAKAKAENKYIFVDAFTTWCGPCKYMAANIFPMPEAGAFFNDKYINVKVQLDTTAKDNDDVKSWYADAHNIMEEFNVRVFPTYLFLNPDGKLVHRAVGSSDVKTFIAKAADALNPDKQYYVLLEKYKAGYKEPAFLRSLAYAASEAYDHEMIPAISKEYLGTQKDLSTPDNIEFISRFTNTTKDPGFAFITSNAEKFDAVKGKGAANKQLVRIVMVEEVYPKLLKKDAAAPDWTALNNLLTKKYPAQADEALLAGKVFYYQNKKDWNNYQKAIIPYMHKYSELAEPSQLNNYAWTVFENCKDANCIAAALEWSKRSFKDKENPMFIDTYANLLYKMGKKEEAIQWQEKAVTLVSEAEKMEYQTTLDKMRRGEKTWKE
jgi:thiol-disulfide isomerase/thioredoxin